MAIKQIQVEVNNLAIGMYVSRLDRPWSQTPFPLQGFHVRSTEDIITLRAYCDYVYVDTEKGRSPVDVGGTAIPQRGRPAGGAESVRGRVGGGPSDAFSTSPLVVRKGVYTATVALRDEMDKAQTIVKHLKGHLTLVTKQIAKGKLADYDKLRHSVDDMVSSVLRCPDAFTWLIRLREQDARTHDHSLRSALWAVQFARFIGMEKQEVAVLCMGTLLKDVGKLNIANGLLRKPNRSAEEQLEYESFVARGVEMLRDTRAVEPRIISVVRYHCERLNGTGFPERLSGNKIPLLARIAGIATVFDAISNPEESDEPVSPSKAVSSLYNMRGVDFQEDLVVQFIQSIGLYPTGTLVELTSGDIGVVVEQHPDSRLTPQVAVLDQFGGDLNKNFYLVNLKDQEATRQVMLERGREQVQELNRISIARDLEPTGYDVDLSTISTVFMKVEIEKKKAGLLAGLRDRFRE
ncbi:MAG: DUF3391 domain-containing protein [Porticoccaceae bacterium]|nr:DUF3391 domain-containing protein [Porticoccaceae bacterium]